MITWNILQSLLRAKISKYLLNYKITESKWKQFSLICSSNLTSFYHFYFLYTKLNIRFKQLWKLCISFRDRVDLINLQGLSFWFYLSNSVVVSTRPFLFSFPFPIFYIYKVLGVQGAPRQCSSSTLNCCLIFQHFLIAKTKILFFVFLWILKILRNKHCLETTFCNSEHP